MYSPLQFPVRRPLLDLAAVAAITDKPSRELLLLIEEGRIRYSFDISTPGAHVRCIRVAAESVHQYINDRVPPASEDTPQNLRATVMNFFPALSESVSITNLARTLNCGTDLLIDLHKTGAIRCARVGRRGQTGATLFDRRSVVDFLISRRLP